MFLSIEMISFFFPQKVLDDAGNDVTPLPLLHSDPNTVKKNQSNILADSSAGTVSIAQKSK